MHDRPAARPAGASHNQTLTYLMRRFEEAGVHPKTRHGQNFLIDLNLLRLLVETAQIGPDDVVLEVGAGTGSLTVQMAPLAARVVSIEIDPQMHQLASEAVVDYDNVRLLRLDALKTKNRMQPELLEILREELAADPRRRLKLVANLPFNVATPVISNLLLTDIVPHSMTVTIQKELADRIMAQPGTKDYGALSIWVQSQCQAELVRLLPPSAFWPRPKVTSAIIHLRYETQLRERIGDLRFFHDFTRAMFLHRRKFLRSQLLSAAAGFNKPQVDQILAQQGLAENLRAEQLDAETMLRLSEAVQVAQGEPPLP
jgi:16S rRNA (adenine1518-N6/adenine1519-N6)-dimethyltransferase